MKYRTDFVTNSSSSSFIVAYKNSSEMMDDIRQFVENYEDDEWSHQYKDVVYDIFKNKISYEEALEEYTKYIEEKAYYASVTKAEYSEFIKKYGSHSNWIKSDEFIEKKKSFIEKEIENFKKNITPKNYIALLEYSTSDGYYDVEGNLQDMLKGFCVRMDNH